MLFSSKISSAFYAFAALFFLLVLLVFLLMFMNNTIMYAVI